LKLFKKNTHFYLEKWNQLRYLCTRFERVLCEFLPAGDVEIEGFVAI